MDKEQITNIAQLGTGFVLIIGLLLVVYELNQAKSLTFAEMISQGYSESMQDSRTLMGENPAVAIAKSCDAPEDLTSEELLILRAYYNAQMSQIERLRSLEAVAAFGVPWPVFAQQILRPVLSTAHGRWWFERAVAPGDAALLEVRDRIMASEPNCQTTADDFKYLR